MDACTVGTRPGAESVHLMILFMIVFEECQTEWNSAPEVVEVFGEQNQNTYPFAFPIVLLRGNSIRLALRHCMTGRQTLDKLAYLSTLSIMLS
jgi:hypothetical protein